MISNQVSEANCTDGDNSPPQSNRDGRKLIFFVALNPFRIINKSRKDDNSEKNKENEKEQLLSRCFECLDEDFKTRRVLSQFEETKDSDDGEKLDGVTVGAGKSAIKSPVDVERDCCDEVNDVDRGFEEDGHVGAEDHSSEKLSREPDVWEEFHVKERGMSSENTMRTENLRGRVPGSLLANVNRVHLDSVGRAADVGHCCGNINIGDAKRWMRFEAEADDWYDNEDDVDHWDDLE